MAIEIERNPVYLRATDLDVLSGAITYLLYVPFHFAKKPEFSKNEERELDALADKLLDVRDGLLPRDKFSECPEEVRIDLSSAHVRRLIRILEAALAENADDDAGGEVEIEIHIAPRDQVAACLGRLRELQE